MKAPNLKAVKTVGKQILLLALPYLLTFLAFGCFAFIGASYLKQAIENSPLAALFNAPLTIEQTDDEQVDTITFDANTAPLSEFPVLTWGDQWATLSIDELPDASFNGAKVYVGDDESILKKGVGKYYGSNFCGEGGKIVMSAHCNMAFYCLEDVEVGYTVRVHTVYGEYVYRVDEIFIFESDDNYVVLDPSEEEQLLLYTCYPRGLGYRRQRIGLRCSKVSGVDFR